MSMENTWKYIFFHIKMHIWNINHCLTTDICIFLAGNCCICHWEKETPRTTKCKNFHLWEPKFPECSVRWPVTLFSHTCTSAFSKAVAGRGIIYLWNLHRDSLVTARVPLPFHHCFRRSCAITDLIWSNKGTTNSPTSFGILSSTWSCFLKFTFEGLLEEMLKIYLKK